MMSIGLNVKFIYQILDIFFFKYGLYKIDLFQTILKTLTLFIFIFAVIVFDNHHTNDGIKR